MPASPSSCESGARPRRSPLRPPHPPEDVRMAKPVKPSASIEQLFGRFVGASSDTFSARDLTPGEVLIQHGKPSGALHWIAQGDLDVRLDTAAGEVDLGTKASGEWVGELGMLDPGPASA